MSEPVALQVVDLCKSFGALQVTRGVNLELHAGDRRALIGPNGAGKTSLIHQITGVLRPSSGAILLAGRDILRLSAQERVCMGLVRTFQINSLFPDLTVAENVTLAALANRRLQFRLTWGTARRKLVQRDAEARLSALGLSELAPVRVGRLAYGKRRLVEIALALALNPSVLLLDEPAAGLSRPEIAVLLNVLRALPRDIAVLVVEHDMGLVFDYAESISVLVEGRLLRTGTVDEIRSDRQVRDVYLGRSHVSVA